MGKQRFALLLLAVFFSFYSFFFHLSYSHAETLHGTPQDDSIVSTGTYDGIISYEGDDTIVIESSSQIIGDSQQTSESSADADVTAIDSGSGDDQVINSGNIGANADAIALPGGNVASRATADAAGISTQDGADLIL
ncbi:MAG: hypothetical protein OEM61_12160, partial [Desulfobacteraceae bacterium]|nr:hypothetical protein [Desulfobacteraceae bacterium]